MPAGRKRKFEKNQALDQAMRVFWQNGYSGTSVSDLTEALSINKPSLYAAFGNKEQLFGSCLEHYMAHYAMPRFALLSESDHAIHIRLRDFLYSFIELFCDNNDTPLGCFFVKSRCEAGCESFPCDVAASLQRHLKEKEHLIAAIFAAESDNACNGYKSDAQDKANYLMTVMYGLAVLARNGASMKSLKNSADLSASMFAPAV